MGYPGSIAAPTFTKKDRRRRRKGAIQSRFDQASPSQVSKGGVGYGTVVLTHSARSRSMAARPSPTRTAVVPTSPPKPSRTLTSCHAPARLLTRSRRQRVNLTEFPDGARHHSSGCKGSGLRGDERTRRVTKILASSARHKLR